MFQLNPNKNTGRKSPSLDFPLFRTFQNTDNDEFQHGHETQIQHSCKSHNVSTVMFPIEFNSHNATDEQVQKHNTPINCDFSNNGQPNLPPNLSEIKNFFTDYAKIHSSSNTPKQKSCGPSPRLPIPGNGVSGGVSDQQFNNVRNFQSSTINAGISSRNVPAFNYLPTHTHQNNFSESPSDKRNNQGHGISPNNRQHLCSTGGDPLKHNMCPLHPNQKAKYKLERNNREQICSKCALNYALKGQQIQENMNDQEQFRKREIDYFMSILNRMKEENTKTHNKYSKNTIEKLKLLNDLEINMITQCYNGAIRILEEEKQSVIESFQRRLSENLKTAETIISQTKAFEIQMKKCSSDIEKNYENIIHQMETNPFREILNIYMQKVASIENFQNLLNSSPSFEILHIQTSDVSLFLNNFRTSVQSSFLREKPSIKFSHPSQILTNNIESQFQQRQMENRQNSASIAFHSKNNSLNSFTHSTNFNNSNANSNNQNQLSNSKNFASAINHNQQNSSTLLSSGGGSASTLNSNPFKSNSASSSMNNNTFKTLQLNGPQFNNNINHVSSNSNGALPNSSNAFFPPGYGNTIYSPTNVNIADNGIFSMASPVQKMYSQTCSSPINIQSIINGNSLNFQNMLENQYMIPPASNISQRQEENSSSTFTVPSSDDHQQSDHGSNPVHQSIDVTSSGSNSLVQKNQISSKSTINIPNNLQKSQNYYSQGVINKQMQQPNTVQTQANNNNINNTNNNNNQIHNFVDVNNPSFCQQQHQHQKSGEFCQSPMIMMNKNNSADHYNNNMHNQPRRASHSGIFKKFEPQSNYNNGNNIQPPNGSMSHQLVLTNNSKVIHSNSESTQFIRNQPGSTTATSRENRNMIEKNKDYLPLQTKGDDRESSNQENFSRNYLQTQPSHFPQQKSKNHNKSGNTLQPSFKRTLLLGGEEEENSCRNSSQNSSQNINNGAGLKHFPITNLPSSCQSNQTQTYVNSANTSCIQNEKASQIQQKSVPYVNIDFRVSNSKTEANLSNQPQLQQQQQQQKYLPGTNNSNAKNPLLNSNAIQNILDPSRNLRNQEIHSIK